MQGSLLSQVVIGTRMGVISIVDVELDSIMAVLLDDTRAMVQSLSWAFPHLPVLCKGTDSEEKAVKLHFTTEMKEESEFVLCKIEVYEECRKETSITGSTMNSLIAAGNGEYAQLCLFLGINDLTERNILQVIPAIHRL